MPVLIDSGFRRGTDIVKALCLGAQAVCVGRPYIWGLGAFGQPGVERALEILRVELFAIMQQVGAPTEIYERPRTRFVADFIGEINIVEEGGRPRALRPEKIRLVPAAEARVAGVVETANFLGGSTLYRIRAADGRSLLARETHAGERALRDAGDAVGLAWSDMDSVVLEN